MAGFRLPHSLLLLTIAGGPYRRSPTASRVAGRGARPPTAHGILSEMHDEIRLLNGDDVWISYANCSITRRLWPITLFGGLVVRRMTFRACTERVVKHPDERADLICNL